MVQAFGGRLGHPHNVLTARAAKQRSSSSGMNTRRLTRSWHVLMGTGLVKSRAYSGFVIASPSKHKLQAAVASFSVSNAEMINIRTCISCGNNGDDESVDEVCRE